MLIKLFYDYVHEPSLREEFQKEPLAVLNRFKVSTAETELLRTRNADGIRTTLYQQIDELLRHALEIESKYPVFYPVDSPNPTGISPNPGQVNAKIAFAIRGSWLSNVSEVVFSNGQKYHAQNLKVTNDSNFGAELTGNVELPAAGFYTVRLEPISNDPPGEVPGGFTAV